MSDFFHCKQFTIRQRDSAMKLGTDSILLGSWTNLQEAKTIADIGTGTGILAIMAAQRNTSAKIFGFEIDTLAAAEAEYNRLQCPWKSNIKIIEGNVKTVDWPISKVDVIMSNPPFFKSNKNEKKNNARTIAREQIHLNSHQIINLCKDKLSENGHASLIVPYSECEETKETIQASSFHLYRLCLVRGNKNKSPVRVLVEFGKTKRENFFQEEISIEWEKRHQYTEEYRELTKDFYLNF